MNKTQHIWEKVTTVAGQKKEGFQQAESGDLRTAIFHLAFGIAVDDEQNIYVADQHNCVVRKLSQKNKTDEIIVGIPHKQGFQDGEAESSLLNHPQGIVLDAAQRHLYICDSGNHCVRKVDLKTNHVSTLCGSQQFGDEDGAGKQAKLHFPRGICMDSQDNLYICDSFNHSIRKVSTAGQVTTVVQDKKMYLPEFLCINPSNDKEIYFTSLSGTLSHSICKLDVSTKEVVHVAGTGRGYEDNENPKQAVFHNPNGIFMYKNLLFVADSTNHRIRCINLDKGGQVSTFAGCEQQGLLDSDLLSSCFFFPTCVVVKGGVLYVSDKCSVKKI